MKILIYGVNYAPELTGIGKYSGEMAEWFASKGHDVRVVTAPPYYPEWKVKEGYTNFLYRKELKAGVEIWRCPLYVPARPSGLKRIIHLASFALFSLPVMLRQILWRPDVVFVVEPPLFCAPTAWMVSRFSGGKCWLHVQDFEVDAAFDLGIIPFGWMKSVVSACERWLMRRFDTVSTISTSMLAKLREKGVLNPVMFPNWADLSRVRFDSNGRETFREELGVTAGQSLCLYSGNIAVKQGLEILIEVARELPDCRFVICGDGANRGILHSRAEELCLRNITFLPLQPLDKLSAMLSAADIHLVIQKKGAADLVMPSKLTNILAVGGLAVATAEEDTELGMLGLGGEPIIYRCEPENQENLVKAIKALKNNTALARSLKAAAKAYAVKHIEMENVLQSFEKKLNDVIYAEKTLKVNK